MHVRTYIFCQCISAPLRSTRVRTHKYTKNDVHHRSILHHTACVFLLAQRRKRGLDVRTYVYVYCLCAGRRPGGPAREPARGPVRGPAGRPCKAGEGGGRVGVPREGRAAGRAAGGHGSRREAGPKARPGDALRCGPGTGPCAARGSSPKGCPKGQSTDRPSPSPIPLRAHPEGGSYPRKRKNRPFSEVGGWRTARSRKKLC